MAGPLEGIRVLDLSAVLSGPIAAGMLADQGADVVKIESPDGDTSRRIGPRKADISAMFLAANRGKRSLVLDLKQAAAQQIVRELALRADVLIENFRPGAMDRLGLGHEALLALNPRLVYLSISGFGQTGPNAGERAYDAVIQAVSGISASHRNQISGDPQVLAAALCDKLTALTAAQAICAALLARTRTGKGQWVELAMLDAAVSFQWPDAMYNHIWLDDAPPASPEFGVSQKPWKTSDGYAVASGPQPVEFAAMCAGFGRPELAKDPRFASVDGRFRHAAALREELDPSAAAIDTTTMLERMRAQNCPVGRVNERHEVLADPQVRHNGTLVEVDHGALGRVRLPRSPAQFNGTPAASPGPAPHLGQHAADVLGELGHDAAQQNAWREAGVLGPAPAFGKSSVPTTPR
ncbi:CaiB/BaiF CoA transferase family protein [Pseudorhodoferax sp.]|uniref:CaiB/BaiF CoA transferase family protein n=1 Tax=Pseudorhodoferax sp. TaxID=1993553 RepID=UPI002DD6477C|nr:CoA transferase [Pseudorhodoferax sp.]